MSTSKVFKLCKTLCSSGPVPIDEIIEESEKMGVSKLIAEEALGRLASEGEILIKDKKVMMG